MCHVVVASIPAQKYHFLLQFLSPPFPFSFSLIFSFFSYLSSLYFTLPTLSHASFSLFMCFFVDFFHYMLVISSKATIFISKSFNFYLRFVFPLHVLFFDFFHCMFVVSSKATIFISKSFNFYFQTP
ncbi:hypothetical protein AAZX31_18G111500 [Glycine max]